MSHLPAIRDSDVVDGLSVKYLKLLGIWGIINDYRTTGKRNSFMKFKSIMILLLAVPYISCQIVGYFVIKLDVQKLTILSLYSLPGIQLCNKMLVFWICTDRMSRLFGLMKKDFLTSVPENKRGEAKKIYLSINKKCNRFCMAAFVVNTSIIANAIALPEFPIDYITHGTGNMAAVPGSRKILCAWYPLPMDQSPYYEVIFAYETTFAIVGSTLLAVYTCLFYQVLICLYAQFSVLGYHISTLKIDTTGVNTTKNDIDTNDKTKDSAIYKQLYAIIDDHKKLLSFANELRSVYNPLVTMILGFAILLLIVAVFKFFFGETLKPMFIFKASQFLVYQSIEVSMYCIASSAIETASSDLHFAIYSSDWYKADVKFRKTAQMVMLRARKGETLTAIGMYPVNVETILSILQFTYSVVTLMSRMNE